MPPLHKKPSSNNSGAQFHVVPSSLAGDPQKRLPEILSILNPSGVPLVSRLRQCGLHGALGIRIVLGYSSGNLRFRV